MTETANAKNLRIKYQQRGVKLKWLIDKKLSFLKNYFLALYLQNISIRKYFPNAGKYGREITPYLDTFRAVNLLMTGES